jgi:hypothetical protein
VAPSQNGLNGPALGGLTSKYNTVGYLWMKLVNEGYNAYLVPVPALPGDFGDPNFPGSGGNFPATNGNIAGVVAFPPGNGANGGNLLSTLNYNGSGQMANELVAEAADSQLEGNEINEVDVGLVGFSAGAGAAYNISAYLKNLQTPNLYVQYAATIDAIAQPTTGPANGTLLANSPAALWGGWDYNAFETTPHNQQPHTPGPCASIPDADVNIPYGTTYNHITIGQSQTVFDSLAQDLDDFFYSLSD